MALGIFKFAIVLYNKTSELENIDEARMQLFCHGNKTMEKFHQPKQLFYGIQNMQCIKLVSGSLTKQDRPSPEGWGWSWDDEILSWTPSLLYGLL